MGGLNPQGTSTEATCAFVSSPVATPDLIVIPSAKDHGVVGLRPDAKGLVMPGSNSEAWRFPSGTPDVPSPLVFDGLVYLCRDGSLLCLDAKTGKQVYRAAHPRFEVSHSPLAADGHVYLTARDGTVTVIKAGREFKEVAVNKLPDEIAASPAISNGRIYLHGWKALYAIGPPAK